VIVNPSAVMVVLSGERGAERYDEAIAEAPRCRMPVANFLEAAIVIESRGGPAAGRELDAFLEEAMIALGPVTPTMRRPRSGPGGDSARATTRQD
jgi:uncharacterized protein with PIN domain